MGRRPDSWRRVRPGPGGRPRCARRADRRVPVRATASLAPQSGLPRDRHRALRHGREHPQVRHQHGLPARYRRIWRRSSVRPPVRGPAGCAAARRLLSGLACLDRLLPDGVLFPADGYPAPPGQGPPRGRRGPRGGLFLRPAGPGGPFPVPRPHERRAGLVPAPVPLVAAAKIACSRRVEIDARGWHYRTD